MKTVLVTGANGFIGCNLCLRLLAAGFLVRGAVRGMHSLPEGVERVVIGELCPETDWGQALHRVDTVVHLAAKVHDLRQVTPQMERDYFTVNTVGTKVLARAAATAGVRSFLLASSVKAMADSTEISQSLTEDTPPMPVDAYGRSKLEAERELAAVAGEGGDMAWMALRLPLVYGLGAGGNLLRLMRLVEKRIPLPFGLVRNRRSLLSLDNLTDLLLRVIATPEPPSGVYLISDGADLSTPELIRLIGDSIGRTPMLLPVPPIIFRLAAKVGDRLRQAAGQPEPSLGPAMDRLTGSLCVDTGRIRRDFGWKPPSTPAQGIQQMVRHFLATRDGN